MDEQYCLQMFRLARQGDQQAQEWFQRHFRDIMRNWLDRHPGKDAAYRLNSETYYLDRAFQSAWNGSSDSVHMEFTSLPGVLRYLYASLNGQILDTQRILKKGNAGRAQEPNDKTCSDAGQLWAQIEAALLSERERRLGYLLFHCGLKPAEIVRAFPQEFSDTVEIVKVRLAILHSRMSDATTCTGESGNLG